MERDGTRLAPAVVRELLDKLRPAASDIVLIGGQALNFWAERYGSVAELTRDAPYTSKDIDFYGHQVHVTRCAQLLGGEAILYGVKDRSICSGIVTTAEGIQIDFVTLPLGVQASEIPRRAITFAHGKVMHPMHVLMSRAANVVHIPRNDALALKQLRAAVFVVREFIRKEHLQAGSIKAAQRLSEEAYKLATEADGIAVWKRHGVDLFAAVTAEPSLGEKFLSIRYPQMRERLAALRR